MGTSRILSSWASTAIAMREGPTSAGRRRERLWARLRPALARTPALAKHAGGDLSGFPTVSPQEMRSDYGAWNSLGLSDAAIRAAAEEAETGGIGECAPGVVSGYSTGTSGIRGLFVVGEAERETHVGQSLARLLPWKAILGGARIGLFLRANSSLYRDVGRGPFRFSYSPLDLPPAGKLSRTAAFAPNILIAPPHALAEMARLVERGAPRFPAPMRCFYGAEPMGDAEREWIGTVLGVRPDPIYQATEGFVAASCGKGRLHLNDDSLVIELEPVRGTPGYRPVVTDLHRSTQPIVRVRLDDYVEMDPAPCACGRTGRTIRPVCGRVGDLWPLGGRAITPREVTDVVASALGPGCEWIAEASPARIRLRADASPDALLRASATFRQHLGIELPVEASRGTPPDDGPKRRRVRWTGPND